MNSFSVWIIDPYVKSVGIVELSRSHTLLDMYRLIGCSMVQNLRVPGLDRDDMLYFDEEALTKRGSPISSFMLGGCRFLGRGLVIGTDNFDNECSPETRVGRLIEMVKWL